MSLTSYRTAPPRVRGLFKRSTTAPPHVDEEKGLPLLAGLATTYSPMSYDRVPLALRRLTAEFGMGSGLITLQKPPGRRRTEEAKLASRLSDESNQVERAISTGQLHALPRFHIRPIDVVVFHGSSGRTCFEAGFPLRCLQRLSIPYIATLHCGWRHNRSTRDTFTPVLSY